MDHCCISVEQVYGESKPAIPEGYKQIDFRPYKTGELFRLRGSGGAYCAQADNNAFGRPYIILEKLPPKSEVISSSVQHTYEVTTYASISVGKIYKKEQVTIPEGYKFKAFRPPVLGDWYITTWFEVTHADKTPPHGQKSPRIILEKV